MRTDMVNTNIGAPLEGAHYKIAFRMSDKIMRCLVAQGYHNSLLRINMCAYVSEEVEAIRLIGVQEGLALAKCDNVCRALFGLE